MAEQSVALAAAQPDPLPSWKDGPTKRGDLKSAFAGGEAGLMEVVMATHDGMTTSVTAMQTADEAG